MDNEGGLRIAVGFLARLKGKLFDDPEDGRVLVLTSCHDVHTYGMRFDLDIAFADDQGLVLKAMRNVPPRRRVGCRRACMVIERSADNQKEWFKVGQVISIGATGEPEGEV